MTAPRELEERVRARLAKVEETRDEGVYARAYAEDCRELLSVLRLLGVSEQAPPSPSAEPFAWDLVVADVRAGHIVACDDVAERVIADMRARDEQGARKYGVRLQPGNGRDQVRDAYEEALDGCVYARAALAEIDAEDVSPSMLRRRIQMFEAYEAFLRACLRLKCAALLAGGK